MSSLISVSHRSRNDSCNELFDACVLVVFNRGICICEVQSGRASCSVFDIPVFLVVDHFGDRPAMFHLIVAIYVTVTGII